MNKPLTKQQIADKTEEAVKAYLGQRGFWAFRIPKTLGGQPFDIIAANRYCTLFVDAKHLQAEEKSFPFERIEANQETAMFKANLKGVPNTGFVVATELDAEFAHWRFLYLSYKQFINARDNGEKSVKLEALIGFEEYINNLEEKWKQ